MIRPFPLRALSRYALAFLHHMAHVTKPSLSLQEVSFIYPFIYPSSSHECGVHHSLPSFFSARRSSLLGRTSTLDSIYYYHGWNPRTGGKLGDSRHDLRILPIALCARLASRTPYYLLLVRRRALRCNKNHGICVDDRMVHARNIMSGNAAKQSDIQDEFGREALHGTKRHGR